MWTNNMCYRYKEPLKTSRNRTAVCFKTKYSNHIDHVSIVSFGFYLYSHQENITYDNVACWSGPCDVTVLDIEI